MSDHTARVRVPADIGLALQQARLARGLSQKELAAELDISQSAISEMESGRPTLYLLRLLAMSRALGIEITAAWEEGDDASRS